MKTSRGRSSDILKDLFGDTSEYTKSVSLLGRSLNKKFPDKQLSKIFTNLGHRTATILPMAFCEAISSDLEFQVDIKVLATIGLACVIVSTHDDIVDEMPSDQKILAGLTYGGDITNLYALKSLLISTNPLVVSTLIDSLIRDHYLQTRVIDKLWKVKNVSNQQYFDAVKHWSTFCSIGPLCALALASRMNLKHKILRFSTHYGIIFQLLDDLIEVDEDRKRGYKSIPGQEGYPYIETFKQMHSHIELARGTIGRGWKRTNRLLNNIEDFVNKLESEKHR